MLTLILWIYFFISNYLSYFFTEIYEPITTSIVANTSSIPGVSFNIIHAKNTPKTGCEREIIVTLEGR